MSGRGGKDDEKAVLASKFLSWSLFSLGGIIHRALESTAFSTFLASSSVIWNLKHLISNNLRYLSFACLRSGKVDILQVKSIKP